MSQQVLDLRRSVQIVRRHKVLVGVIIALGIAAGCAYSVLNPPMLTAPRWSCCRESQSARSGGSEEQPPVPDLNGYTATQEVIAGSHRGAFGRIA